MTTMIELRSSLNLDPITFASSINITPQMVRLIENGDVNPGKDVIEKVKEVYGKDLEPTAGKEAEGRTRVSKKAARKKTTIILQSPAGSDITLKEIENKVGDVDAVYVRIDENRAYWVKGEETGSVELW